MDLLLTHGYFLSEDARERQVMKPYPPLGLLYVSAHLKGKGLDVGVFDSTFRGFDEYLSLIERERPPVVGLYCTLMTKPNVLRMTAAARRIGAAVVLGGPEPPGYAEEYLAHGADVVVVGEGELTMEELVPRLSRGARGRDLEDVAGVVVKDGERVVRTPPRALIRDLDGQPLPDRDSIDVERYLETWRSRHGLGSISLTTARGCPYTCRWCSRSVFGESHRRRSTARVADEVQHLVDRYRPDMLWYVDDVFTIHGGWVQSFADEMEKRRLRVPFECISRAERINEGVADALVRLGCRRLWIGSESGSPRVLEAMDRRMTVEQVRNATRLLQARRIEVGLFIMLGYEGEELADLRATVEHLKRTRPDTFLTTVAYPIKGTAYYEQVAPRLRRHDDWTRGTDRDLVIRGRHTGRFYGFARRWMEAEVARDRHWRAGRVLRAARAATAAGAGRLGMALFAGRREP